MIFNKDHEYIFIIRVIDIRRLMLLTRWKQKAWKNIKVGTSDKTNNGTKRISCKLCREEKGKVAKVEQWKFPQLSCQIS